MFIGLGLAVWSGLPSWCNLTKELARFVESEGFNSNEVIKLIESDLLAATSVGIAILTPQRFRAFMRQACRVDSALPHEVHEKVVKFGPSCFILQIMTS